MDRLESRLQPVSTASRRYSNPSNQGGRDTSEDRTVLATPLHARSSKLLHREPEPIPNLSRARHFLGRRRPKCFVLGTCGQPARWLDWQYDVRKRQSPIDSLEFDLESGILESG